MNRVLARPVFCRIEVSERGSLSPVSFQVNNNFYDSNGLNIEWVDHYGTIGKFGFSEVTEDSAAGIIYKQKCTFQFPSMDERRADRIALLSRLRYISLITNKGHKVVIGRNDFKQNKLLVPEIKSGSSITEVQYSTRSIFPLGFIKTNQIIESGGLGGELELELES